MYDAQLGRFANIDPLADMFTSYTPYHFTRNNPISRMDPTGMSDEEANPDEVWKANFFAESAAFGSNGGAYGESGAEESNDDCPTGDCEGDDTQGETISNGEGVVSPANDNDGDGFNNSQLALGVGGILYGTGEMAIYNSQFGYWLDSRGAYRSTSLLDKVFDPINKVWKYRQGVQGFRYGVQSAKKAASWFKLAGRYAGGLSLGLDYLDYRAGRISGEEAVTNSMWTGVGLFGGPVGFFVSGTYFVAKNTYGDAQAIRFQQSIGLKRANGTLSHPKLKGGGAARKSRNPKF